MEFAEDWEKISHAEPGFKTKHASAVMEVMLNAKNLNGTKRCHVL